MGSEYNPIKEVKQELRIAIANSAKIFDLISNKDLESADDMLYINVFPYLVDPNTIQETTNRIYFDVSETEGRKSKAGYWDRLAVDVLVVCDASLDNIKMDSGDSRIDLLCDELRRMLVGKKGSWLGEIRLIWDKPYTIAKPFLARSLRFDFEDVGRC